MRPVLVLAAGVSLLALTACASDVTPVAPASAATTATAPKTAASPSAGERPLPDASGFPTWLDRFRQEALAAGISKATLDRSLAGIRFDEAMVRRDRSQPETVQAFVDYFDRAVNPTRVAKGQEMLRTHAALLDRIERQYGVPRQVLVAFWGMETNYGSILGANNTFQALATLAYEGRRGPFFTGELMAALRLVELGWVQPDHLVGSWAGAVGHTQFMPSVYLKYAVDGDGDGRRDLRTSVADALTSAARFLQALGWDKSVPWGQQVVLPAGFDYHRTDLANARPVRDWRAMGVRGLGSPLPAGEAPAAIIVPQGHTGPAFLVYAANFKATTGWNAAISYALAVGHLSDRLKGAPAFAGPRPAEPPLTRTQVIRLQTLIHDQGIASLEPDGLVGRGTREAVRLAQQAVGLIPDGYPTPELIRKLEAR